MYGKLFAISALLGSTSAWSHTMATGCGDKLTLYAKQFTDFVDYNLNDVNATSDHRSTVYEAKEFISVYTRHAYYTKTKKSKLE